MRSTRYSLPIRRQSDRCAKPCSFSLQNISLPIRCSPALRERRQPEEILVAFEHARLSNVATSAATSLPPLPETIFQSEKDDIPGGKRDSRLFALASKNADVSSNMVPHATKQVDKNTRGRYPTDCTQLVISQQFELPAKAMRHSAWIRMPESHFHRGASLRGAAALAQKDGPLHHPLQSRRQVPPPTPAAPGIPGPRRPAPARRLRGCGGRWCCASRPRWACRPGRRRSNSRSCRRSRRPRPRCRRRCG